MEITETRHTKTKSLAFPVTIPSVNSLSDKTTLEKNSWISCILTFFNKKINNMIKVDRVEEIAKFSSLKRDFTNSFWLTSNTYTVLLTIVFQNQIKIGFMFTNSVRYLWEGIKTLLLYWFNFSHIEREEKGESCMTSLQVLCKVFHFWKNTLWRDQQWKNNWYKQA